MKVRLRHWFMCSARFLAAVGLFVGFTWTTLTSAGGQLRVLDSASVLAQGGKLVDVDSGEPWNPKDFELTTEDGFKYALREGVGILYVTDPYGNRVSYGASGYGYDGSEAQQPGATPNAINEPLDRTTAIDVQCGNLGSLNIAGELLSYDYDSLGRRTKEIIAAYLIASIGPVVVTLVLLTVAQSARAAPVPQLPSPLDVIWNWLSGGGPWPMQFNWPPAGMPNAGPPGVCTVQQHSALEAAKDLACGKPSTCKGTDNCAEVDVKIQNKTDCIAARLAVMDICFQGGDEAHWGQLHEQLNGMNRCVRCKAKLQAAQQCTRGGV